MSHKSGVKKENIQKLYNYSLKKNLNITGLMYLQIQMTPLYFSETLDTETNKI